MLLSTDLSYHQLAWFNVCFIFFLVNKRNLKPAFLRTDQQKSVDRNFSIIKKCALITFATFSAFHYQIYINECMIVPTHWRIT